VAILVNFFPLWFCCTKKNLATLSAFRLPAYYVAEKPFLIENNSPGKIYKYFYK
jgi:hypothetical protein